MLSSRRSEVYGIFERFVKYLMKSPKTLEHDAGNLGLRRIHGFGSEQDFGPIRPYPDHVPGHEFRPTGADFLRSAAHNPEQLEQMRIARDRIRMELDKMPGGRPENIEDMRKVLPHINVFHNSTTNCIECAMAVRDIQKGRAAVAGWSKEFSDPSNVWLEVPKADPAAIEKEVLQSDSAHRVVFVGNSETGQGHAMNIQNYGGKAWWIDAQVMWHPVEGSVHGGPFTGISDHFLTTLTITMILVSSKDINT